MSVGILLMAALIGVGAAQQSTVVLVGIAIVGIGAVALLVGRLGITGVIGWIVVSGAMYPFIRVPEDHPLVTFNRVVVMGCAMSLVFSRDSLPWSRGSTKLALSLVVFALIHGIRSALTVDPLTPTRPLQNWIDAIALPTAIFFAVATRGASAGEVRRIAGAMALGGAIIAVIGIGQWAFGFDLATRLGAAPFYDPIAGVVRVSGPYARPEELALCLIITLAGTLLWFRSTTSNKRWIAITSAVVQMLVIGLTLFRAAWIGAVLVFVSAAGLRWKGAGRLATAIAVLVALPLVFAILADNQVFASRVMSQSAIDNVYSRFAIYLQGIDIFSRSPLFGVGEAQYLYAGLASAPRFFEGVSSLPYPHSTYLAVLVEQGLVGFASLVLATLYGALAIIELGRRARVSEDVALSACAAGAGMGYLTMSATLTMLPFANSNIFFAIMLGLVCARLNATNAERGRAA